MITITVKDRSPELMQKLNAAITRFVAKGVTYIHGQMVLSMNEPKTGREYDRGKDGVHVASAPGESPAVDSSNYVGSLQIIANSLEAKVGTPIEYAPMLEEGTSAPSVRGQHGVKGQKGSSYGPSPNLMGPHRGGILPRPLWEKTALESLPTLEAMLANEIRAL